MAAYLQLVLILLIRDVGERLASFVHFLASVARHS